MPRGFFLIISKLVMRRGRLLITRLYEIFWRKEDVNYQLYGLYYVWHYSVINRFVHKKIIDTLCSLDKSSLFVNYRVQIIESLSRIISDRFHDNYFRRNFLWVKLETIGESVLRPWIASISGFTNATDSMLILWYLWSIHLVSLLIFLLQFYLIYAEFIFDSFFICRKFFYLYVLLLRAFPRSRIHGKISTIFFLNPYMINCCLRYVLMIYKLRK